MEERRGFYRKGITSRAAMRIQTYARERLGSAPPLRVVPQSRGSPKPEPARCRIDSNAPTDYTASLESSEVRMERPLVIEIVSDVV
jgi:hypothetical protein